MYGSLAQLLAYWAHHQEELDRKELVILVLETVRDDLSQAQTKDGRPVLDAHDLQSYFNDQIAELRHLIKEPDSKAAD